MPFLPDLSFPDGLIFSSGGGEEGAAFASAMFSLFILFIAAKAGEEIFRRINQPGVIGEMLGGFIVGPFALGLADVTVTAEVFAELGVIILLFTVGLEVRIDDLLKVGPMAIAVGTIGFILPIIAGAAIGLAIGEDMLAAVLTGLALAATSIGITSRVLAEMGVLDRAFARVILGAAIVDDILALLAIGLLSGVAEGSLGPETLLTMVAGIAFVGIGLALAPLGRRLPRTALHLAQVRRHADRARLHPHVRRRPAGAVRGPGGHHRRLRGRPDDRRDAGARGGRARLPTTARHLRAVLLRRHRLPTST